MFKIIIMALLIFIGMVGYDNITDKAQPTTPVQQEQQKVSKHEKSAAMALFTSLLPPKEEWPSPVHKFYLPLIWMRLSILSVKTRTGRVLTPCRVIFRRH